MNQLRLYETNERQSSAGGRREAERKPATAPPRDLLPSSLNRLDTEGNSVKSVTEEAGEGALLTVRAHRCRTRTCKVCGPMLGAKVRKRLLERTHLFSDPWMVTFTVDRKNFAGPKEAYEYVKSGRYVSRLIALLGVKVWVVVLEFQMKTGEGWPHWHLLIDREGKFLDLSQAWHWWRDTWKIGGLDLGNKRSYQNAESAVRYLSKYLIKYPHEGFPSWVLEEQNVRFVQGSRAVGALVSSRDHADESPDTLQLNPVEHVVIPVEGREPWWKERAPLARAHRTLRERVESCGRSSNVLMQTAHYKGWVSSVPWSPTDIADAVEYGYVSRKVGITRLSSSCGTDFVDVVVPIGPWESVELVLLELQYAVDSYLMTRAGPCCLEE